ncbi:MAG: sugar ABC transporter ATP-binding protein, partial [Elusimicrobiota bacterium]
DRLFAVIAGLKERGCGIIYITHRMEEIYRIGDRVTVLRDGKNAGTAAVRDCLQEELVSWMLGRRLSAQFPQRAPVLGQQRLRVEGFAVPGDEGWLVRDVSLTVAAGEVVGVAGLQGSGNSELFGGIFGAYDSAVEGKVWLDGEPFAVRSPKHSIANGMAYLTNDRKATGLVLEHGVAQNITMASLRGVSVGGWLSGTKESEAVARRVSEFSIKTTSVVSPVASLSGGNQQKVVLAKWAETRPRVLLLDEPTRGVDIGAKHEIYELLASWAARGMAIMLITSDLQELLALSDRIIVMHRGRISAVFTRGEATPERVLTAAMGECA